MKEFNIRLSQKLYFMRTINGSHNRKIFSEDLILTKIFAKAQYSYSAIHTNALCF